MTTEFQRGMRRAAQIAELYADENMRMAHDTLLADPILMHPKGQPFAGDVDAAIRKSERLTIEGADHASQYRASKSIAEMIRREARETRPRRRKR